MEYWVSNVKWSYPVIRNQAITYLFGSESDYVPTELLKNYKYDWYNTSYQNMTATEFFDHFRISKEKFILIPETLHANTPTIQRDNFEKTCFFKLH